MWNGYLFASCGRISCVDYCTGAVTSCMCRILLLSSHKQHCYCVLHHVNTICIVFKQFQVEDCHLREIKLCSKWYFKKKVLNWTGWNLQIPCWGFSRCWLGGTGAVFPYVSLDVQILLNLMLAARCHTTLLVWWGGGRHFHPIDWLKKIIRLFSIYRPVLKHARSHHSIGRPETRIKGEAAAFGLSNVTYLCVTDSYCFFFLVGAQSRCFWPLFISAHTLFPFQAGLPQKASSQSYLSPLGRPSCGVCRVPFLGPLMFSF